MDWEQLRERTLGEVGTALATEGAGVAGGFIGAGFIGRQIQDRIKKDAEIVTLGDKAVAWASNNVPKLAVWWLLRKYAAVTPGEVLTPGREVVIDLKKAFAGSVFFDTIMRLFNNGKNPATAQIGGWAILGSGEEQKSAQADLQRLIQENSALRTELNKALQRLATYTPTAQIQPQLPPAVRPAAAPAAPIPTPTPPTPLKEEIAAQQVPPVTPPVTERERRYGFMQYEITPPVAERQRKYGFAGEEKNIATMFGML